MHNKTTRYVIFFLLYSLITLMPMDAMAASISETLGKGICEIISALDGLAGKSIASLAVMFIAIAGFFGKANWGLIVTVIVGIGVIFGAKSIAEAFGITGAANVCSGNAAFSGVGEAVGQGLCVAARAISGDMGKALATIAVIMVALTAMFGRINWGTVLINIAAIGTLFGSGAIVSSLADSTFDGDCLPKVVFDGASGAPSTVTYKLPDGTDYNPSNADVITTTPSSGVLQLEDGTEILTLEEFQNRADQKNKKLNGNTGADQLIDSNPSPATNNQGDNATQNSFDNNPNNTDINEYNDAANNKNDGPPTSKQGQASPFKFEENSVGAVGEPISFEPGDLITFETWGHIRINNDAGFYKGAASLDENTAPFVDSGGKPIKLDNTETNQVKYQSDGSIYLYSGNEMGQQIYQNW